MTPAMHSTAKAASPAAATHCGWNDPWTVRLVVKDRDYPVGRQVQAAARIVAPRRL